LDYQELWIKFRSNYVHLSTNSSKFELACFERYFAILYAAQSLETEFFWLMDTDLWPTRSIDKLEKDRTLVFSASNPKDAVSPHMSHWSIDQLRDFVTFLCDEMYQSHRARLQTVFTNLQKLGRPGGVCDMTAIAIWLENRQLDWTNTFELNHPPLASHNFEADFMTAKRLKIVPPKLNSTNSESFAVQVNGVWTEYNSLHFQGRAKYLAYFLAKSKRLSGPHVFWSFLIWLGSVPLRVQGKLNSLRRKRTP
jgi:hypothetical protein